MNREGNIFFCPNNDHVKSTYVCNLYVNSKKVGSRGRRPLALPPPCARRCVNSVPTYLRLENDVDRTNFLPVLTTAFCETSKRARSRNGRVRAPSVLFLNSVKNAVRPNRRTESARIIIGGEYRTFRLRNRVFVRPVAQLDTSGS